MKTVEQKKEELVQKTFRMLLRILLIFGLPAVAAFFLGKWVDTQFSAKPYGTLIILLLSFAFSWFLTIRMYFQLQRQYEALDKEEEEEQKALNLEKK